MAKTYNSSQLAKLLCTNSTDMNRRLRKAGIRPLRVVETEQRTFRQWGKDAHDLVLVWLSEKNAPAAAPIATPEPTPLTAPPEDMLVSGGELGRILVSGTPPLQDSVGFTKKLLAENKQVGQDGKPFVPPLEQMQLLFGSVSLHSLKAQLDRIEAQLAKVMVYLDLATPKEKA